MKPNFALSLSHESIVLLHRTATEWEIVGKADPASPVLGDDLAAMITAAIPRAPDGIFCKVIIPDQQIKYLKIAAPQTDQPDYMEVAAQALEGATPYAVEELVFDVCQSGETLAIAAVARETLVEAETFAVEHGFKPVSFAAQPDPEVFDSEPFFGQTKVADALLAPGATVAQDESALAASEPVREKSQPDFVTQRRVPTFRTDASDSAPEVPGFAEPNATFRGADPVAARRPSAARSASAGERRKPQPRTFDVLNRSDAADNEKRGIVLAAVSVIALGLLAFISSALGVSVFDRLTGPPPEAQFTAPQQPELPASVATPETDTADLGQTALREDLSDEDLAVLNALRTPQLNAPAPRADRTDDELRAAYAVTGIWPLAPDAPAPPPQNDFEDFYQTSIDPIENNFDAIALPAVASLARDEVFANPLAPAPAGTRFDLDARGMVIPTAEGAMNPDGILVYAGAPPVRQPDDMLRVEAPGEDLATRMRLAGVRPQARPDDLIQNSERAAFSGLTRSELGQIRPKARLASAQEAALAATSASLVPQEGGNAEALIQQPQAEDFVGPTARAVAVSLRPDPRPSDFDAIVSRAQTAVPGITATTPARPARVTPGVSAPKIPSNASVSREATIKNALNLRRINLIGVYGKPSSRRALVRMENGRFRKVKVGDRIDGGRVSAISESELRYQKGGRSIVLKMPKG